MGTGVIPSKEFISVGRILGVFGIEGWVKVFSFTEPRQNIISYSPIYISYKGGWVDVKVSGGRTQGKGIVMRLENVTGSDQVSPLIGAGLAISSTQLKPTEKNEFYWCDLIGLTIINSQDELLGQVDYLLGTGAHDVLVVKKSSGNRERLIPFVMDEIVKLVDLKNKLILVDWGVDY